MVVYAGGALVLLWFSSTIVSAVNAVPVVSSTLAVMKVVPVMLSHDADSLFSIPAGTSSAPVAYYAMH